MEVLENESEGGVAVWPDPVDAVVVEPCVLGCTDGATPDADGEVDGGLPDIDRWLGIC